MSDECFARFARLLKRRLVQAMRLIRYAQCHTFPFPSNLKIASLVKFYFFRARNITFETSKNQKCAIRSVDHNDTSASY